MNYYYERGAGSTPLMFTATRKLKRFAVWYFNDKFGLCINVFGLLFMVLK